MLQGTTPCLSMTIEGHDLTDAQVIFFTMKCQGHLYNFTGERITVALDGEDTVLFVHLTQEETLKLRGKVALQVRWKDAAGEAYGTDPDCELPIEEVYYKGVI